MPRDIGTGLYHYPEGTPGNPAQTIFSTRYNTFINDLTNTLNQALPVNMGGTGADNATAARDNLKAEVRGVQVTNYDTHVFEAGSFWSAAGATSAPDAVARFNGTCIIMGDGTNDIYIQVQAPGASVLSFSRKRNAGVWGAWVPLATTKAALDADYVNVTGDFMTGDLVITKSSPTLVLNKTDVSASSIYGTKNDLARWRMDLGDNAPESGTSTGSNFALHAWSNDASAYLGPALTIFRHNRSARFDGPVDVGGESHFRFAGAGAGGFYDTQANASRFFAGTEPGTDYFRIFCAPIGINAIQVDASNATVTVANGIKYGANNSVAFQWSGSGLGRIIDGTAAVLMWDNNSCSKSAITNGYQRFAGGTILQWGTYTGGADGNVTFPIAFPANVLNIVATMIGNVPANTLLTTNITSANPSFFNIQLRYSVAGGTIAGANQNVFWMAVGV
jgi:hypothetical protein